MKKYLSTILITASVLIFAVLVTVIILVSNNTDQPIHNADQLYSDAVNSIDTTTIEYRVSLHKKTTINEESYIEDSVKTVKLVNSGDSLSAYTEEICKLGEQTTVITEQYEGGKLYLTLNNGAFLIDMERDEFLQRNIPAIILDPLNYSTVTGIKTRNAYDISFSMGSRPEEWLEEKEITMDHAEGSATLSKDGSLKSLTYSISYQTDQRQITMTVDTQILSSTPSIPRIMQEVNYLPISTVDIPKLLERACGLLIASETTTAHYNDRIFCEVFGDDQTKSIQVDIDSQGEWSSAVKTEVTIRNTGKTGADISIIKDEQFTDGKYTIAVNNAEPTEDNTVSSDDMRTVCQDILVSTIILPEYIKKFEISTRDQITNIIFTPRETLIEKLRNDALTKLYADAEVLDRQKESYRTDICCFYLSIDTKTGLPLNSGFSYTGTYIINALPYKLEYSAEQTYQLTDE